jgi:hypothetical protein
MDENVDPSITSQNRRMIGAAGGTYAVPGFRASLFAEIDGYSTAFVDVLTQP